MGLLDYYRQFEDVDEEELNKLRRARRAREKALALEQVPDLDLSGTEWPEFPNSEVVNASIYTARGRVNGYPDRHAEAVRRALAERHDVEPERIVLGNGAAELLQAAALALLGDGDELLTPWPSYPLYPLMAARAGGRPVPVEDLSALADAVTDRTRLLVICNPNDPTGSYLTAEQIASIAAGLPERVHVLVDEALVHFQDAEPVDAVLRPVDPIRIDIPSRPELERNLRLVRPAPRPGHQPVLEGADGGRTRGRGSGWPPDAKAAHPNPSDATRLPPVP